MADLGQSAVNYFGSKAAAAIGGAAAPQAQLLEYKIWSEAPVMLPGFPALLTAWARGRLSTNDLRSVSKWHGINLFRDTAGLSDKGTAFLNRAWQLHEAVKDAQLAVPSPIEVYQLLNRRSINDGEANQYLKYGSWLVDKDRERILQLRHVFPGPSDLVRFALREVWAPAVVEEFGYDAEYPQAFEFWMDRQGYAEPTEALFPGMPPEYRLHWARAYWRAHWDIPSPTQAYMMLHRLRPNRIRRYQEQLDPANPAGVDLRPFGLSQLLKLLRVKDYPPPFREQLAAINASLLTRVDMRRMQATGQIDRAEVIEQFRDRGYVPQDAVRLADFGEFQARSARFGKLRATTKAQVLDAYRVGSITRDVAAMALYTLSLTDPLQLAAYRALPEDQRLALALGAVDSVQVPDPRGGGRPALVLRAAGDVGGELANVDALWSAQLLKKALVAARKCYLDGRRDLGGTRAELVRLQVTPRRIGEYLQLWETERDCRRRELATAKVQSLMRDRIITREDGERRLVNLGWPLREAALLVMEVARDVALDTARAAQSRARTLAGQQRAAEQLVRAAQGVLSRARAELARHGSPAQLRTWIARSLIGTGEVLRRLDALGWPQADAARLVEQGLQDQRERRERAARQRQRSQPEGQQP